MNEPQLKAPLKKLAFLVESLKNSGYDNFSHRNARVNKF